MEQKRFFREHRGSFSDSMATIREVRGVDDISEYLNKILPKGYLRNIRIDVSTKRQHRTPSDQWGNTTYMVVADFDGFTSQCVGYANFALWHDGCEKPKTGRIMFESTDGGLRFADYDIERNRFDCDDECYYSGTWEHCHIKRWIYEQDLLSLK